LRPQSADRTEDGNKPSRGYLEVGDVRRDRFDLYLTPNRSTVGMTRLGSGPSLSFASPVTSSHEQKEKRRRPGGHVLLVRRLGRQIEGWNKQGQTTAVNAALMSALLSLSVDNCVLDCEHESNGERPGYYCWDLLLAQDTDLTEFAYAEHYRVLQAFAPCPLMTVLPTWTSSPEKERVILELLRSGAEGVAFKNREAPYRPGRAGQHFKLKFEKTATERVKEEDLDADSVRIEMLDGRQWREVCGVKVKRGTVRRGQVVEVRYLSATANQRLSQPTFLRVRYDVSEEDCSISQFEFGGRWAAAYTPSGHGHDQLGFPTSDFCREHPSRKT
jgi:hypothetical protein